MLTVQIYLEKSDSVIGGRSHSATYYQSIFFSNRHDLNR